MSGQVALVRSLWAVQKVVKLKNLATNIIYLLKESLTGVHAEKELYKLQRQCSTLSGISLLF